MKRANQRRVHAVVALKLLEVIRDRDLPGELLEDEDPTVTIPRRFGLSDVVERQIRTFKEEARRGGKLSDREIGDLFRLVIRRPDAEMVFHEAGRLLAEDDAPGRWPRALPTKTRFSVARSRVGKRLRKLFGRPVGVFETTDFLLEAREHFLIDNDPGGDACHLVSGLCQQVLAHTIGGASVVNHTDCRSRGSEVCRWEGVLEAPPATIDLAALDDEAEAVGAQAFDEPAFDEQAVDGQVFEEQAVGAQAADEQSFDEQAVDEQAFDEQAFDEQAADERPVGAQAVGAVAFDAEESEAVRAAALEAHASDAAAVELRAEHEAPQAAITPVPEEAIERTVNVESDEAHDDLSAPLESPDELPAALESDFAPLESDPVFVESDIAFREPDPAPLESGPALGEPDPAFREPGPAFREPRPAFLDPRMEHTIQAEFSLEAEEQLDVLSPHGADDEDTLLAEARHEVDDEATPLGAPSLEAEEEATVLEAPSLEAEEETVPREASPDTAEDAEADVSEGVPRVP